MPSDRSGQRTPDLITKKSKFFVSYYSSCVLLQPVGLRPLPWPVSNLEPPTEDDFAAAPLVNRSSPTVQLVDRLKQPASLVHRSSPTVPLVDRMNQPASLVNRPSPTVPLVDRLNQPASLVHRSSPTVPLVDRLNLPDRLVNRPSPTAQPSAFQGSCPSNRGLYEYTRLQQCKIHNKKYHTWAVVRLVDFDWFLNVILGLFRVFCL